MSRTYFPPILKPNFRGPSLQLIRWMPNVSFLCSHMIKLVKGYRLLYVQKNAVTHVLALHVMLNAKNAAVMSLF